MINAGYVSDATDDDRDLEPGEPEPPEDDFEPEQTDLPQPKTDEPEE